MYIDNTIFKLCLHAYLHVLGVDGYDFDDWIKDGCSSYSDNIFFPNMSFEEKIGSILVVMSDLLAGREPCIESAWYEATIDAIYDSLIAGIELEMAYDDDNDEPLLIYRLLLWNYSKGHYKNISKEYLDQYPDSMYCSDLRLWVNLIEDYKILDDDQYNEVWLYDQLHFIDDATERFGVPAYFTEKPPFISHDKIRPCIEHLQRMVSNISDDYVKQSTKEDKKNKRKNKKKEKKEKKEKKDTGKISSKMRFDILERDKYTCAYCGRKPPEITIDVLQIDHIDPVSNNGPTKPNNLVVSCRECNIGKFSRTLTHKPDVVESIVCS